MIDEESGEGLGSPGMRRAYNLGRRKARIRKRDQLAVAKGVLWPEQISIATAFAEQIRKSPLIVPKISPDEESA